MFGRATYGRPSRGVSVWGRAPWGNAGASLIDPETLSAMTGLMYAQDAVLDGSDLCTDWDSRIGTAQSTQPVSTKRLLWNATTQALEGDGVDDFMEIDYNPGAVGTVFHVGKYIGVGAASNDSYYGRYSGVPNSRMYLRADAGEDEYGLGDASGIVYDTIASGFAFNAMTWDGSNVVILSYDGSAWVVYTAAQVGSPADIGGVIKMFIAASNGNGTPNLFGEVALATVGWADGAALSESILRGVGSYLIERKRTLGGLA